MRIVIILGAFALRFIVIEHFINAGVVHVAQDGDGSNGENWRTAYRTIGDALIVTASGDEIWVKKGLYNESVVLESGVSLYGGFAGTENADEFNLRDWVANPTILDATRLDRSTILGATDALLDGLTITGGVSSHGGGLACLGTSMTVINCEIIGNRAEATGESAFGGGIYCVSASLKLFDCSVSHNTVEVARSDDQRSNLSAFGGGIYFSSGQLTVLRSNISENQVLISGEAFEATNAAEGGGLYLAGTALLQDCSIYSNDVAASARSFGNPGVDDTAFARGGGLSARGDISLSGCSIIGNSSSAGKRFEWSLITLSSAGAAFLNGDSKLVNCIIFDNWSSVEYLHDTIHGDRPIDMAIEGNFNMMNCTIVSRRFFEIQLPQKGNFFITNCIMVDGHGQIPYIAAENGIVSYSTVAHGSSNNPTNIDLLPRFVNFEHGDFRLLPDSPCIDSASSSGPAFDLLGNPRPVDIPGVGREGEGAFDMGAYEFQLADLPQPVTHAPDFLLYSIYWQRQDAQNETPFNETDFDRLNVIYDQQIDWADIFYSLRYRKNE